MLRFVRVSGTSNGESRILYHVNEPKFLSSYKVIKSNFNNVYAGAPYKTPIIFNGAIAIDVPPSSTGGGRYYEAVIYVPENQPAEEAVEEVTTYGVSIVVLNENGNVVCDNGIPSSAVQSSPVITGGPGEMTSEPIDGPGEMTTEPIDGPGEMM